MHAAAAILHGRAFAGAAGTGLGPASGCGVGVASVVAVAEGAEAFGMTAYVHGAFLIQRRVERQGKRYCI